MNPHSSPPRLKWTPFIRAYTEKNPIRADPLDNLRVKVMHVVSHG